MKKLLPLLALPLLAFCAPQPAIPDGWFPFQTDTRQAPDDSLASVAFLNPRPADQRISLKDGHFALPDGTPIRFFGSNCCFANAFPEKDVAPLIARRMKQLGFNIIRFHHMDNRHIWNADQTALSPDALDRLHWFLFQLKQNGIYANLNLHVSRIYKGLDKESAKTFKFGKSLDRFYPPFIQQIKDYARDLLTTVNPYTGLAPVNDPGILCVEINNENPISDLTNPSKLKLLDNTPYGECLLGLWRQWLANRYENNPDTLRRNWKKHLQPFQTKNLIEGIEPFFEGKAPGAFEQDLSTPGTYAVRLLKDGKVSWAYQMHFLPLELKDGQHYTVRFQARASVPRDLSVDFCHARAPWRNYNPKRLSLSTEWTDYHLCFTITNPTPDIPKRFSLNFGGYHTPVDIQVRNLSVHEGDLPPENLDQITFQNVPFPASTSLDSEWADFRRFLYETDCQTSKALNDYLKKDLRLQALVTDSQASYNGAYGLLRESTISDYIDMHAYWQHPSFAPGHSWSSLHWTIGNTPMTDAADGANLSHLARWRYAGMPYTISEYDHPAPSEHTAEMFPLLGSFAAFQDWDAIYQFAYGEPRSADQIPRLQGYFAMSPHPGKVILAHVAALAFRQRLVAPAPQTVTITVPRPLLDRALISRTPAIDSNLPGYPSQPFFHAKLQTRFADHGNAVTVSPDNVPAGLPFITPQITWQRSAQGEGVYTVNAPACRMITGHIGNQPLAIGDVKANLTLPPKATAAFTVTALDAKPVADSSSLLVALVGTIANPGMVWNEQRTTILNKWGSAPAIARFIPADITLPGNRRPTVTALDPAGRPLRDLPVSGAPGAWSFRTDPQNPTLWFRIRR